MVVYIGKETRLDFGQKNYHQKISSTQKTVTKVYLCQLVTFFILISYGVFINPTPTNNFLKNLNVNFVYYSITLSLGIKMVVDITRFTISYFMNKQTKVKIAVKNPEIVEDLGKIEYMLLDKTGTITKNSFKFVKLNHLNENVDFQHDEYKLE